MSFSQPTLLTIRRLKRLGQDIAHLFAGRDQVIDLMQLALVCREHMLLLGPPGSGKSELVQRFALGIQAKSFQYLLTRFTEPAELFGPLDLRAFRKGHMNIVTDGMLPTAEIAFLDEVFQASSAILNTLLSVVHERTFYNGARAQKVPLISLFAAANALPDDGNLAAFSDRFALRAQVEPIADSALGDLFDKGWCLEVERIRPETALPASASGVDPAALAGLYHLLPDISIDAVRTTYIDVVRRLRAEGVLFSERRLIKGLKLIRAAALLAERTEATQADFWPLNHIWNGPEEIVTLREVVQPLVDEAGGPGLTSRRLLESILDDYELLRSRHPDSESAWMAHLSVLGDLRREVMLHYPAASNPVAASLLQQINAAIRDLMERTAPDQSAPARG